MNNRKLSFFFFIDLSIKVALLLTMDGKINPNKKLNITTNVLKMNVLYIKYDEGGIEAIIKDYPITHRLHIIKKKLVQKQNDWDDLAFEYEGRSRIGIAYSSLSISLLLRDLN
jgi:hypothetical protein